MPIINLTGHPVNIFEWSALVKSIKSDWIIRLPFNSTITKRIAGIPIFCVSYGKAELPKESDTIIIVSKLVCEAHKTRKDLYIIVNARKDKWNIVWCDWLARNPFCKYKF